MKIPSVVPLCPLESIFITSERMKKVDERGSEGDDFNFIFNQLEDF